MNLFHSEKEAIDFIIDAVLPFVNAKDSQTLNATFHYLEDRVIRHPAFNLNEDDVITVNSNDTAALNDIWRYCIWLLYMPLSREPFGIKDLRLPYEYFSKMAEKYLNFAGKARLSWKAYGNSFIVDKRRSLKNSIDYIGVLVTDAAVSCLSSTFLWEMVAIGPEEAEKIIAEGGSGDFDEYTASGSGFDYIGCCPKCETFFAKKRKNQEYCSARCGNAAGADRHRQKEKDKNK